MKQSIVNHEMTFYGTLLGSDLTFHGKATDILWHSYFSGSDY